MFKDLLLGWLCIAWFLFEKHIFAFIFILGLVHTTVVCWFFHKLLT